MLKEHMEMNVKTIIMNNCKEVTPLNLKPKTKNDLMFSPSRFSFNEQQFDTMSLQIVEYINQNHGDAKPTANK